jgi:hypothetical protein
MSFTTPTTVPSGMSVAVLAVDGHAPAGLPDFTGEEVTFLVDLDPPHLVQGCGRLQGETVRFHEKDIAGGGKDIRVWEVRVSGSRFVAEHAAQF